MDPGVRRDDSRLLLVHFEQKLNKRRAMMVLMSVSGMLSIGFGKYVSSEAKDDADSDGDADPDLKKRQNKIVNLPIVILPEVQSPILPMLPVVLPVS